MPALPRRSGVALHDPLDLGGGDEAPVAARAGHDVEVVHLEAVGRAAGMVAARDEGDVAVADRHGLVEEAVVGVDALDAEAVLRVQAVVVGLLEVGDPREVVLVVAVRGIGRPVAGGGEDLGDEERVGRSPRSPSRCC